MAIDEQGGDLYFIPDRTAKYLTVTNSAKLLFYLASSRASLSAHSMDVYMHRALLWAYTLREGHPDAVMHAFADVDFQADTARDGFLEAF